MEALSPLNYAVSRNTRGCNDISAGHRLRSDVLGTTLPAVFNDRHRELRAAAKRPARDVVQH